MILEQSTARGNLDDQKTQITTSLTIESTRAMDKKQVFLVFFLLLPSQIFQSTVENVLLYCCFIPLIYSTKLNCIFTFLGDLIKTRRNSVKLSFSQWNSNREKKQNIQLITILINKQRHKY